MGTDAKGILAQAGFTVTETMADGTVVMNAPAGFFDAPDPTVRRAPKIVTEYWAKPIPLRQFDWSAVTDNYDGAEDSGNRGQIGFGRTEAEAVADLQQQLDDASDASDSNR